MEIKLQGKVLYTVTAEDGDYSITSEIKQTDGIDTVHIVFDSVSEMKPPVIEMAWEIPSVDIQGTWYPTGHLDRTIPNVWAGWHNSAAAFSSPMYCLYSSGQMNRMTYACSDAMISQFDAMR